MERVGVVYEKPGLDARSSRRDDRDNRAERRRIADPPDPARAPPGTAGSNRSAPANADAETAARKGTAHPPPRARRGASFRAQFYGASFPFDTGSSPEPSPPTPPTWGQTSPVPPASSRSYDRFLPKRPRMRAPPNRAPATLRFVLSNGPD